MIRQSLYALLILVLAGTAASRQAEAGTLYADPLGGWTYTLTGDTAVAGSSGSFDSLDGTWDHDNNNDQWDGTMIGAGRPGGVTALSSGGDAFLRLQDTGDPVDSGMGDPGSNRNILFAHDISSDGASAAVLDDGITFSFRARIATGSPLDDIHPDGGGGIVPWPAGGDGYLTSDGGIGNFGVAQATGGTISFSLALASETGLAADALIMNALAGTSVSPGVDWGEGAANFLALADATQWHEFWITIGPDTTATGTHRVDVYADGSLTSSSFLVTAGDAASYASISHLLLGLPAIDQSGAFDADFFSWAPGIHAPVPEPSTALLLACGLAGLALRARRLH